MPQNEFIELHRKRFGRRFDHFEKLRKKEGRVPHRVSQVAQTLTGIKAKIHNRRRYAEKAQMKKTMKMHEEKDADKKEEKIPDGAIPSFLLDRQQITRTKILSNMIKQKRKEKADVQSDA